MHIHILGIGGTFMGGMAMLAQALGHRVTGSDQKVYPPMSTQLESQGIQLHEGYDPGPLDPAPDLVVIGNALSRGNPAIEYLLDRGLPYTSGAQWVAEQILRDRWVLAVAGTHGKTTTSSMLAWILDYARLDPGFLIGGVPGNFGVSARLGATPFFVIEADEYDTAFFDKRSKFVHYRPRTAILNNLEYDHADIFPDVGAIQRQFHHLVRTVPASGLLVVNGNDERLAETLRMGCWSHCESFGVADGWQAEVLVADGSRFGVKYNGVDQGIVNWSLIGDHNVQNGLAAVAAARHAGVPAGMACAALAEYRNVKRRLERLGTEREITVYDDFAHHPTAIRMTIDALRASVGDRRIIAVLEARSNTMRLGVHRHELAAALRVADQAILLASPDLPWNIESVIQELNGRGRVFGDVDQIVAALDQELVAGDQVLIMSNGAFGGIHAKLLERLAAERVI